MTDTLSVTINAGGIVGKNTGSIKGCNSSGEVSGMDANSGYAGGITGLNEKGTIIGCASSSEVEGNYAGGIAGTNEGSIVACYSCKSVQSGNYIAGGIVGSNGPTGADSSVIACYSTATVSGKSKVGSIIGLNHESGAVSSCYWSGDSGNGVGTDNSSSAETQKVENDGWSSAMTAMNNAIDSWNGSNGDACPYEYTATGASPSEGIPLVLR